MRDIVRRVLLTLMPWYDHAEVERDAARAAEVNRRSIDAEARSIAVRRSYAEYGRRLAGR